MMIDSKEDKNEREMNGLKKIKIEWKKKRIKVVEIMIKYGE
jgi:hypothetical protein